jgi:hypothetical protein
MTNQDKAWIFFQLAGLAATLGINDKWFKGNPYTIVVGYSIGTIIAQLT